MKAVVGTILVGAGLALSCTPVSHSNNGSGSADGSSLASVNIGNTPAIQTQLSNSINIQDTAAKSAVLNNLVYQIKIHQIKGSCLPSVNGTDFESPIVGLSSTTFAQQQVIKGCDYNVVMLIGSQTSGSSAMSVTYFGSDTSVTNLTKDSLNSANPRATINLFVTADGAKMWPTLPSLPVPAGGTNVSITPCIGGTDCNSTAGTPGNTGTGNTGTSNAGTGNTGSNNTGTGNGSTPASTPATVIVSNFTSKVGLANRVMVGADVSIATLPTDQTCYVQSIATVSPADGSADQTVQLFMNGTLSSSSLTFAANSNSIAQHVDLALESDILIVYSKISNAKLYVSCDSVPAKALLKAQLCTPSGIAGCPAPSAY